MRNGIPKDLPMSESFEEVKDFIGVMIGWQTIYYNSMIKLFHFEFPEGKWHAVSRESVEDMAESGDERAQVLLCSIFCESMDEHNYNYDNPIVGDCCHMVKCKWCNKVVPI